MEEYNEIKIGDRVRSPDGRVGTALKFYVAGDHISLAVKYPGGDLDIGMYEASTIEKL